MLFAQRERLAHRGKGRPEVCARAPALRTLSTTDFVRAFTAITQQLLIP